MFNHQNPLYQKPPLLDPFQKGFSAFSIPLTGTQDVSSVWLQMAATYSNFTADQWNLSRDFAKSYMTVRFPRKKSEERQMSLRFSDAAPKQGRLAR